MVYVSTLCDVDHIKSTSALKKNKWHVEKTLRHIEDNIETQRTYLFVALGNSVYGNIFLGGCSLGYSKSVTVFIIFFQ